MKMICVYLLALLLCVPATSAQTHGSAMENCHHMAGGMGSMGDEQSHDCCDHSASMALHNADCDLNCEHCGSDLGNSNLAIMADIVAIATSPPPGINSQSPSIPSPPDTSEIIPPIG